MKILLFLLLILLSCNLTKKKDRIINYTYTYNRALYERDSIAYDIISEDCVIGCSDNLSLSISCANKYNWGEAYYQVYKIINGIIVNDSFGENYAFYNLRKAVNQNNCKALLEYSNMFKSGVYFKKNKDSAEYYKILYNKFDSIIQINLKIKSNSINYSQYYN